MRCSRLINFAGLHLHKALYMAALHPVELPAHRSHLWKTPPEVRWPDSPHQHPAALASPAMALLGGGAMAQCGSPYNQIFTVLSDRFLSHLRDLFICESIGIVQ